MPVEPSKLQRPRKKRQPPAIRSTVADDEADRVVAELRALGPEAEDFARRLVVVNQFGMWQDCPHDACRRARTCRGEDIECLDERRPELTRRVLQYVVMLLCTAGVSSDAFYDYLDAVTADIDADGDCREA